VLESLGEAFALANPASIRIAISTS
jgi:hypothetical protein